MFKCSTCEQMLPRESFGADKHAARGFSYRCFGCSRARQREQRKNPEVRERRNRQVAAWRDENPDKVIALRISRKQVDRDRALLVNYGLEVGRYESMLNEQDGGCAICFKTPEENGKRLAVDHDHTCCPGKKSCGRCVRGLLCDACNHSIGRMEDDVSRLERAIAYIKRSR
jgi:hypothetical protein